MAGISDDDVKKIVKLFTDVIYRMEFDVIERVTILLDNEKKIREARESFVARMVSAGWTEGDARNSIVGFQRQIEETKVVKEQMALHEFKKKPVKKPVADEEESGNGSKPIIKKPVKKTTDEDEIDRLCDELSIE